VQTRIEQRTLGDRYRLVRRIGAGGMGTVWEAEDEVLKRRVAVKILAPALCDNGTIAARFEREAQAAARLTHPNVAQVFDYGEDDGCPYIVLELVPGSTLRAVLERRGPLPPGEVAGTGAQIADALAAAHAEGIVHRDVKPGNVMVCPDGRVKVMDFGIADAAWFEPLTDTGTIMATARYISPEQATGRGATGASDVYSLGAVLYELFAGRLPFDGDSPIAIAHAHAYEVPEPLAEAAPGVPASLRAPVEAAMRKDPAERPTAAELAAALRAAGSGDEPTAVLPTVAAGADAAGADEHTRGAPSARTVLGVAAGLVALVLLVALAIGGLTSSQGADPLSRQTRQAGARSSPTFTPTASPAAGPEHKAEGGKALGHDPHHHDRGHGDG